jgi:hypothetical protein
MLLEQPQPLWHRHRARWDAARAVELAKGCADRLAEAEREQLHHAPVLHLPHHHGHGYGALFGRKLSRTPAHEHPPGGCGTASVACSWRVGRNTHTSALAHVYV